MRSSRVTVAAVSGFGFLFAISFPGLRLPLQILRSRNTAICWISNLLSVADNSAPVILARFVNFARPGPGMELRE